MRLIMYKYDAFSWYTIFLVPIVHETPPAVMKNGNQEHVCFGGNDWILWGAATPQRSAADPRPQCRRNSHRTVNTHEP